MLWRKSYFRSLLNLDIPLKTRLSLSKNLFVGKKAFIFAAGPSLSNVDFSKFRHELKDSLVICIKQSVDLVCNDCDLMLMNFCNFSNYDWPDIDSPVFWTSFAPEHIDLIKNRGLNCSAVFEVIENAKNDLQGLRSSTAGREFWGNFNKLDDGKARWGPGLMYELAIPLALHAGVSHIHIVGWDIGTKRPDINEGFMNEHFYKDKKVEMKTKITNLEVDVVAKSTKSLRFWLESQNIGLSVVSDRSLVDKSVKREMQWMKDKVF